MGLSALLQIVHADLKLLPVLRQDEHLEVLRRGDELSGGNAVDRMLTVVPADLAVREIPVPGPEVARSERQTTPLLALQQPHGRGLQRGSAFRDALFELGIEAFEL